MIYSDTDILNSIDNHELRIEPFDKSNLRPGSYHLTLSTEAFHIKELVEIDTNAKELPLNPFTIEPEGYVIKPGEYLLVKTIEKLTLNNNIMGIFGTNGSKAQGGLQVLNGSIFTEPNTDNHIILEIQNVSRNPIRIYPGTNLVKIVFCQTKSPASDNHLVPGFFKRNHITE